MSSVIKQYGSNRHPIVNKLGLKRLFAFKTDDMGELKWPPNTPEFEEYDLNVMRFRAYVYKQLQEITIILIKKLTEDLKAIKKDPHAQLKPVDYDGQKPNSPFADFTNIKEPNQSWYQKLFNIDEQELGKYNNQTINDTINEHNAATKTPKSSKKETESYKKQIVQQLNGHIKQLKEEGRICRINKQNIKHDFRKRIEQIKYYNKLVIKIGHTLNGIKTDRNGNITECDYDYAWVEHENDSRLSDNVRNAISKMDSIVPD